MGRLVYVSLAVFVLNWEFLVSMFQDWLRKEDPDLEYSDHKPVVWSGYAD